MPNSLILDFDMEPRLPDETDAEYASRQAIHKAKNAQQAVETAREIQLREAVAQTAVETKKAVLEGLQQIFQGPDEDNPEHMRIIYQKIPVLCIRVDAIDKNIENINDNIKWIVRIVLGAVVMAILGLILLHQ